MQAQQLCGQFRLWLLLHRRILLVALAGLAQLSTQVPHTGSSSPRLTNEGPIIAGLSFPSPDISPKSANQPSPDLAGMPSPPVRPQPSRYVNVHPYFSENHTGTDAAQSAPLSFSDRLGHNQAAQPRSQS